MREPNSGEEHNFVQASWTNSIAMDCTVHDVVGDQCALFALYALYALCALCALVHLCTCALCALFALFALFALLCFSSFYHFDKGLREVYR